ncbi:MAG: hypothetical protein WAL45_12690 [Terracidiphilus sp.]
MKVGLVFICIAVCAFAQEKTRFGQPAVPPASATAACGNFSVSMAVKLDDSQQPPEQPQPGMAQIYFIQDTGLTITLAYPRPRRLGSMENGWERTRRIPISRYL